MVRLRTNTLLRLPVFVICWIKSGWSKLNMFIGKSIDHQTILLALVIVYLLVQILLILLILCYSYILCMICLGFYYLV
ncbi:hypothetical protein LINPERPRIM_LOCUS24030 [Linum perenne]